MKELNREEINNLEINVIKARIILGVLAVLNMYVSMDNDYALISLVCQTIFGVYLFFGSNPMRIFFIVCLWIAIVISVWSLISYGIIPYFIAYASVCLIFVFILMFDKDIKNYSKYYRLKEK